MDKLKVLICGDFTCTIWHPLANVVQEMEAILKEFCEITLEEHFESLGAEGYAQFDVCILHIENYMDKQGTWPYITNELVTYVANGGRLLLPHVPAILEADELSQMFGCRFRMHPPMCQVAFQVEDSEYAFMDDVGDFDLFEERHQLVFDRHTPREVFLTAKYQGGRVPAGWVATFGLGRVIYLMPGHHRATYQNREFRKLFRNLVLELGK